MRTSPYHQTFREVLAEAGMIGVDPRWAEGWARLEWGTLDHLSRPDLVRFVCEMREALTSPAYREQSESLARSYGL